LGFHFVSRTRVFVPVTVVNKCMVIIHKSIGRADKLKRHGSIDEIGRINDTWHKDRQGPPSNNRTRREPARNMKITIVEMGKKGENRGGASQRTNVCEGDKYPNLETYGSPITNVSPAFTEGTRPSDPTKAAAASLIGRAELRGAAQ
jgi:hypothetical protein